MKQQNLQQLIKKHQGTVQTPKQTPLTPPPITPQPSTASKVGKNIRDFIGGAAKGVVSTIKGAADLGEKIFEPVVDTITHSKAPGKNTDIIPEKAYTPTNTAQKIGFGTEQVAEFFLPAGAVRDAEKAINAAVASRKLGKVTSAVVRVAGKASVEAATGAAVTATQTGGNVSEATKAALLFGVTKGVTSTAGEILKAFKIPERLYNTVFKSTYDDALNELKTTAFSDLQKADPAFFDQAKNAGIIKVAANGTVRVDERLAKEALDRGLKGSLQTMANTVVKGQVKSEILAQKLASEFRGTVPVREQQYSNLLNEVAKDYENVGFGELSAKAAEYAQKIADTKGKLSGTDALNLRRFLDKMRFASSFTQTNPMRLSQTQANFKFLADALRTRINAIPGMKEVMKDYTFYIDALDALAKEAKRRGNNQVLSLIDSIFFSTGMAAGEPAAGLSVGAARKILNSPSGATRMGSAIEEGTATKAGMAGKGAAAKIMRRPAPQE